MRILLDECLPRQLVAELSEHTVETVQKSGWAGLKNGKLLEKVSGKYEVLLMIDKRIGHEQEIPGDVAVITVRARSNRIQDLKPQPSIGAPWLDETSLFVAGGIFGSTAATGLCE